MSNCMCPKGCPLPKLAPHNFCGRSCGNGTCTHLPSPSHLPQAAAPAPAPAAAAPGGTKCACNGCNNTVFPPHPYCSRKCGTNACGHAPSSPAVPVAAAAPAFTGPKCSCNGCNSPALAPHPFCSRKCGTNACGHSSSSSSSSAPAPAVASGPPCACPGCSAAAIPSFTFCSKKCGTGTCGHVALGPACRCPLCPNPTRPNPKNPGSFTDFCSTNCSSKACGHPHKPGLIRKLSQTDPIKFNEIKQQFASKWLSTTIPCPTVREIYSVDLSNKKSKFDAYQRMIIAKRPHLAKATAKAGPGNTRRRFHGTNQNCLLGIATMDPCSRSDCSVCLILKSGGLTTAKAKSQTGWGRYGCGIYTTSTSSKANDYSRGAVDAIFMAEVVVGDTFKLMSDDPTLTQPPGGKDSVVAEVSGVNASDELIVYNDDACILKYLVHYC